MTSYRATPLLTTISPASLGSQILRTGEAVKHIKAMPRRNSVVLSYMYSHGGVYRLENGIQMWIPHALDGQNIADFECCTQRGITRNHTMIRNSRYTLECLIRCGTFGISTAFLSMPLFQQSGKSRSPMAFVANFYHLIMERGNLDDSHLLVC